MYKYICISLKSLRTVSHADRKKYLNSLYGSLSGNKKGIIDKFNNAYGYKDVVDDIVSEYPTIRPAKVKSPKGYKSPKEVFYKGIEVDLTKNGVLQIIVPIEKYEHPVEQYSYSTKYMAYHLVDFLKKVYPDLIIESYLIEKKYKKRRDFVLNYFYICLDPTYDNYTIECSISKLLNENEINYIEGILREVVPYPIHINQAYCETCYGYDKKSPYHVEIVYG